ncbi:MAG: serine protease [Lachnospiraceae bacterium]|nr:serine protease [Lachnospiraceae bacterium]
MPELFTLDLLSVIAIILFIAGFALLAVEVAVPGFGVPGISGIICLVVGIFVASDSFQEGVIITLIILALLGVMCVVLLRLISSGKLKSPIVLKEEQTRAEGYLSSNDLQYLLGRKGIATTDLRPSGIGEFDGVSFDVISEGTYITRGTPLIISKVQGAKLIVKVNTIEKQEG